jgi:cytochrome c-type biogenesis protein CcmH
MKRYLGWVAIGLLLGIAAIALLAYGNPSHQSLDDRTRAVAQQLRCPVCQGESVADSPSGIAKEMRAIIRRRLAEGQSPDTIKAYFVYRYGTWILLAPPTSGVGTLAWLAPPLLVLGGAALLMTLLLSWRSRGQEPVRARADYLERVRAELAAEGSEGG